MSSADSLVAEIKEGLNGMPPSRRTAILHDMTDLFLDGAALYSNEQIAVFDEVFVTIAELLDRDALTELSKRMMPCTKAPPALMRKLASHTDLRVSAIVLEQCTALSDDDIAEIASTATSVQLLIIAGRKGIGEAATDALINRGDAEAMRKFVANEQARISHVGFVKLINAAKRDSSLTDIVASRADLPDELKPFIGMLRRSSDAVRGSGQTAAAAG